MHDQFRSRADQRHEAAGQPEQKNDAQDDTRPLASVEVDKTGSVSNQDPPILSSVIRCLPKCLKIDHRDKSLWVSLVHRAPTARDLVAQVIARIGISYTKFKNAELKRRTLHILLSNLARTVALEQVNTALADDRRVWLGISFNRKHYRRLNRYQEFGLSHEAMVEVRDRLEKLGGISVFRGKKGHMMTKIRPIGWLRDLMLESSFDATACLDDQTSEVIVLRDQEKTLIDYEETAVTTGMRLDLISLNSLNERHPVDIPKSVLRAYLLRRKRHSRKDEGHHSSSHNRRVDVSNSLIPSFVQCSADTYFAPASSSFCCRFVYDPIAHDNHLVMEENDRIVLAPDLLRLCRIFSNASFQQGGRFYRSYIQSFPSSDRRLIRIDGKATVELDYSCLHPRILFNRIGEDVEGRDLYAEVEVDDWDDKPTLRDACKPAFQAILNSGSKETAIKAISMGVNFGKIPWETELSVADFVDRICVALSPIKESFFTGVGLRLQNEDSELARAIMNDFVQEGRPIHPVHDSFIVRAEDEELLRNSMQSHYKSRYGFQPKIK